ncbi:hypothetical protein SARC_12524 [Sphaeroforma arctica JP610]|uniref:Uncharacterized protein n=1 Tax=Sphaeroforma arctica JP610 TaxID=667725 RepID=A0A0L0FDV9_9EUKA|nr:hypothetical protein SARC_12524 [Sphaeroforma arctica JP610]KNC74940.1 hypothetical protein SARC_12524 [Sphaeroforma arctica JP610]|eukprot:XP_014148842.1 hypothetical protein SARC_12524 [Sphaeroforma arctica JP610]
MEWYQNDAGLWSLRKTTGVAVSTNHDYINHLEENGCTSERNSEGQCVTMTDTLFQLSWPGPTPAPTPTPSVSEGTVIVARSTPLKCQKVGNELVNCLNNNCRNVADADCVCYKDKEIDTKCQNCNDSGCGGCYNSNTNYQPFQKSPCVDCATAHSGTDGFVCTQCQQGKGCTQGTLNDQTKYSQDMKVYEMEWYITSTGEWSVRKTDGVFISTDQNYINNVQNNGCTDNNCSEFTETLYQTSW